jgi:hypothetical protein
MTRLARYSLFFLAITTPAFADAHYVEVWNPPEARGGVQPAYPVQSVHKAPLHRRASVHVAHSQLHHRVVAATPAAKASVAAVGRRAREPRYDDIPRQITPEGNLLRVDGRRAQAEVER